MKIAIIGAGHVGTALKTGLSRNGHDVSTVGREDNAAQAAGAAELIILAVPFAEVGNVAGQVGSAASGKIVIDATNALSPTMELAVDTSTTSGAEELQKKLPEARVVKAFNTTFATAMATGQINGEKLAGLVAADDAEAKAAVLGFGAGTRFRSYRRWSPVGSKTSGAARAAQHQAGFRPRLRPRQWVPSRSLRRIAEGTT